MDPVWAPDGRELFYRCCLGSNEQLFGALVSTESPFDTDRPQPLFDTGAYAFFDFGRSYDISPTDGRFLMRKPETAGSQSESSNALVFVQNWTEELKRLVPID